MRLVAALGGALCLALCLLVSAAAGSGAARVVATAGSFALVVRDAGGATLAGPAGTSLEPIAPDAPLVAYAATTPAGAAQEIVGLARPDVDRVDVVLADGTDRQVPLNVQHGFSYTAAGAAAEAVSAVAYAGATPVGTVRLPQTATSLRAATSPSSVYGIFQTTRRVMTIARVSSSTLVLSGGKTPNVRAAYPGFETVSPDGSMLALQTGQPSRLVIVDLKTMSVVRDSPVPANSIRALAWLDSSHLIELRQTMGGRYDRDVKARRVLFVEPRSGRVLSAHSITNKLAVHGSSSTSRGLVLLLGSSGWHGPNDQLVAVTATGVRTLVLDVGMTKGVTNSASLAVDPSAGRAYVAVAGGVVLSVDLTTGSVSRHELAPPAGAVSGAAAPFTAPEARVVSGKLAVSGVFRLPGSSVPARAGVYLVDPSTWRVRVVDPTANTFTTSGDRLLTYGLAAPGPKPVVPGQPRGRGLSLYDPDGALIRHLYGSRKFGTVWVTPGYGHVLYGPPTRIQLTKKSGYFGPTRQIVFSLATGRTVANRSIGQYGIFVYRGSDAVDAG